MPLKIKSKTIKINLPSLKEICTSHLFHKYQHTQAGIDYRLNTMKYMYYLCVVNGKNSEHDPDISTGNIIGCIYQLDSYCLWLQHDKDIYKHLSNHPDILPFIGGMDTTSCTLHNIATTSDDAQLFLTATPHSIHTTDTQLAGSLACINIFL